MKDFKGTKGKWSAVKETGYDYDVISNSGKEICWLGLSGVDFNEQDANAKLIAAAPELLGALHKVSLYLEANNTGNATNDLLNKSKQAISKALD